MDGRDVKEWEELVEQILRDGLDESQSLSKKTIHLMAKAAVTVLEASRERK